MESTRIIIDSTLRTKHQAHPGRQEWVSMIECICADGTDIPLLGIFKWQNVLHIGYQLRLLINGISQQILMAGQVIFMD